MCGEIIEELIFIRNVAPSIFDPLFISHHGDEFALYRLSLPSHVVGLSLGCVRTVPSFSHEKVPARVEFGVLLGSSGSSASVDD